jgi:hypothetical protein
MKRLIESKKEYYELARAGKVGNSPKTWASADEYIQDVGLLEQAHPDATIGIRDTRPGSKKFTPYAKRLYLKDVLKELELAEGEYYLTENVVPEEVILAGELGWHAGQWVFFYSNMKTHLRRALAEDGHYAYGFHALMMLESKCVGNELDDLMELFDKYSPGHRYPVVEMTFTTKPHGINDQRLLIWEVRHY